MSATPFADPMLTSMPCRRRDFDAPWFLDWSARLGSPVAPGAARHCHRKAWEFAAICQALASRGMLTPGHRGCGFAVGREPLASLFASMGIDVLATDLGDTAPGLSDGARAAWSAAGQHAAGLDAAFMPGLVDRSRFESHVRFMPQDMRALQPDALGTFDFLWSACSFEHLGSLEAGLEFVLRSTELLRPGGIAVHTTEVNLSSLDITVDRGIAVIYRRCDIERLEARLRAIGCGMEWPDFSAGVDPDDLAFDVFPYQDPTRPHVTLMIDGHVSTSFMIIVRKGPYPAHLPRLRDMRVEDLLPSPPAPETHAPVIPPPDHTLPALRAEVAALREHAAALESRLAGIETSTPWRMATRLHRWIGRGRGTAG